MAKEHKSIWKLLHAKYRMVVVEDDSLKERLRMRLSLMNLVLVFFVLFFITLGLLSLMILATPLRNYLPGFNENYKQVLLQDSYRIDSLQQRLDYQTSYLEMIREVVAGQIHTDSVQPLDSLEIMQGEKLLDEKSAVLDEFVAQYEARQQTYTSEFDSVFAQSTSPLLPPADGKIEVPFDLENGQCGVGLRMGKDENVTSVYAGTVLYVADIAGEGRMLIVQHDLGSYVSIYRGLSKETVLRGEHVETGELLGRIGPSRMLRFELWENGKVVNPQANIIFQEK